jgi:alkylation response protein AidB-like acyl-CoA dehydrogenase
VDFEASPEQRAIQEAVERLLARHAGAQRAALLAAKDEHDAALEAALEEAGFAGVALADEGGPLEAALVVEAVARAAGVVAAGASLLVAPLVAGRRFPGPVALGRAGEDVPLRFGAEARTLLLLDGEEARVLALGPGDAVRVVSDWGYPMGRPTAAALSRGGESLGPGSGARLAAAWRLALALEMVGTMQAALDVTIAYLSQRRQFGRTIASFQAVQHRLADCAIAVEGGRWLAREAAWQRAPAEACALAAAHAAAAARQVFAETHQLSGAIGFTREHPLHVFTLRLQALRLELGGAAQHRASAARARWLAAAARAGAPR